MEKLLTSAIVKNQLPAFVRDDYPVFVTFLEKYYEWLETNNQISYEIDALRNSLDIDTADDYYIEKLKQDLMPYFPQDVVADKQLFLKLVTQFYRSNGTQDSVKFLFRALFNENIDIYYPKEDILKTSDGKWVLPLALRLDTTDNNIFNIEKCLITGEKSKSTAVVEKVLRSVDRQLGIVYTEIYVSNVQRLFETGETVTSTYVDPSTGLDVTVTGRLIGALSEIKIDPKNRGLYYNSYDADIDYEGDPVTIVGGLNPTSDNPIGALAYVGETTKGGVSDVIVLNGGFGFRDPVLNPGSSTFRFIGGFLNAPLGTEATANIGLLDTTVHRTMNVATTTLESLMTTTIASINANVISTITDYETFNVYSIASVTLDSSGGGYRNKPGTDVISYYNEMDDDVRVGTGFTITKNTNYISSSLVDFTTYFEPGDIARFFINRRYEATRTISEVETNKITFTQSVENDIPAFTLFKVLRRDLKNLGALGRIAIHSPGEDYAIGDYLVFTGGTGYGANAMVTEVHTVNNGIKAVTFNPTANCIIGGEGYSATGLPEISVSSVSGANAILGIAEINGDGESFELSTTKIGSISKIRVVSYGYDYTSAPAISLRNADLGLANVTVGQLFVSNTVVYQGTSNVLTTFSAKVDRYEPATGFMRIFDYKGTLDKTIPLNSDDGTVSANVSSVLYYGDGKAKATAKFENGLIRYPGIYLNTDGQISADKRLQDGEKYHNFSYVVQTKTSYDKFKKPLNDIVHPIGTKTFVTKVEEIPLDIFAYPYDDKIGINPLSDTFDVFVTANSIVSNNVSASLTDFVSANDYIIISGASRPLTGTVNVTTGSNTVTGLSTNFINDLIDGDTVQISTGNTEIVKSVEGELKLYTQNVINVSGTSATINVVFDDIKRVNFVNANTIIVDTDFNYSLNDATVSVKKIIL